MVKTEWLKQRARVRLCALGITVFPLTHYPGLRLGLGSHVLAWGNVQQSEGTSSLPGFQNEIVPDRRLLAQILEHLSGVVENVLKDLRQR